VAERTVWRWLAQARRSGEVAARSRVRFEVDEETRARLAHWQGNVAALHRELVAASGSAG
jgi:putative transposase